MTPARVITVLAVLPTIVFWIMIADYYDGGHSGDQLIKLGAAGTAICLAVPLATAGLCLLAWDHYRQHSGLIPTIALAFINFVIIASSLIYLVL
jgi:hypothetical protein